MNHSSPACSVTGMPSRTSSTGRYLSPATFNSRSIAGMSHICEATVSHIQRSLTIGLPVVPRLT